MAIADEVAVYNLALDVAGTRATVASPTENSREAVVCRRWFGLIRDQVLQSAPWPQCRAVTRLAKLATRDTGLDWAIGDPRPGFLFAYGVPTDCIQPNWLSSGMRFNMGLYSTLANPNDKLAVHTDDETPILFYTKSQSIISLWDPMLALAIVHALAANINLPLNGKPARAKEALQYAQQLTMQAQVMAANADFEVLDTIPEWMAVRGYTGSMPDSRYIFPYPMISIMSSTGVN